VDARARGIWWLTEARALVRKPAVADRFYPADPLVLQQRLAEFPCADARRPATAVIVPHAGIEYSGMVANLVYSRIAVAPTAVILGPNHCGFGKPMAVWSTGVWQSPFGDVAVDEALAADILANCPGVVEDGISHINEHSVEMQIPFLKHYCPGVKIVPVAMSARVLDDPDGILSFGVSLGRLLANRRGGCLLVGTTDMTHYESYDEAHRKDRLALDRILALDARGLFDIVESAAISMCGCAPVMAVLAAARELGAERAELLDYRTSAEVNEQKDHVVGYAGIVIE